MTSSEQRSLNWKLLLLLLIASGSLICIVVISQQLIVRHWAEERRPEVKLEIRIPEDGWMSSQGNIKSRTRQSILGSIWLGAEQREHLSQKDEA